MVKERSRGNENMGIQVSLAPTIVIATFPLLNKGPEGRTNYLDAQARNTCVWLTTPGSDGEHRVIGPDGKKSSIAVRWTESGPVFFRTMQGGQQKDMIILHQLDMEYQGLPDGEQAFTHSIPYTQQGLIEVYTVFQVPPQSERVSLLSDFSSYIGKGKLVSGVGNRGVGKKTFMQMFGLHITDRSLLPFGRELRK